MMLLPVVFLCGNVLFVGYVGAERLLVDFHLNHCSG